MESEGTGMKEYIEREALLELYQIDGPLNETGRVPLPVIRQNIMDMPAADVAEVRHAFWSDYGYGVCCTNCGISLFHQDENNNWGIEPSKFTFCPSCGACMDEEDEHEAD